MLKYHDIFVPGGFPRHTYNPRLDLQLEERLSEVKNNLCKLVTVTGQTKSGKTVLASKVFPREEAIWIDGGTVSEEQDFWHVIIDSLDLFQTSNDATEETKNSSLETTVKVEGNAIIAKGSTKVGATSSTERGRRRERSRSLSSRIVALEGLRKAVLPLVIDDFHYIPRELQGGIIRALKPLIFAGLPVIIIAIPHRRYDALKVEREMTGRIVPIQIPNWSNDELAFIPEKGFGLLNHALTAASISRLTNESIGSPHLMQDFCRGIAKAYEIGESSVPRSFDALPKIDSIFRDVAETIGRPIFEKLARGPRSRTDRIPRQLRSGKTVDIYQLVLHALADRRPGLVSIEYEELRSAIRNVSESHTPQLQEVARVLKHMATIAATDQSSTPVIDFEETEKKLHITDPFFAFYLRWGELAA